MELLDYLKKAVSLNASDILFIVGSPAAYKIKGDERGRTPYACGYICAC